MTQRIRAILAISTLCLESCCDVPDRWNPYDAERCSPGCAANEFCFDAECLENPCSSEMTWIAGPLGP